MVIITSKQDGFRRCGVAHPSGPAEYPNGTFTDEQLQQLQDEPMLLVEVVEDGQQKPLNATQTIALVQAAATNEELDKLAEGEERKGVNDAITKRRAELTAE